MSDHCPLGYLLLYYYYYDSKVFKLIIAKKESTLFLLKPISDEELDFVEILHTADYSWGPGLMPVLENVSDIPLDDYLSSYTESESSKVHHRF